MCVEEYTIEKSSLLMEETDEQLIANYKAGNEEAFVVLLDRYMKPLYGFALQMVRESEVAEDIVQEAFIKVWKHLDRFDQNKSFKTWIFAITKNTAFDSLKKRKTLPFSLFQNEEGESVLENISDGSPHPEEILDREATAHDLEEKLATLSPTYQILLHLHYRVGFSLHEVSHILGVPYNTIKSRHKRALEGLRKTFPKECI